MEQMLSGKHAVITGGSKGIGLAIGELFADHGAEVTLVARTADDLDGAVERLRERGATADAIQLDICDKAAVGEMVEGLGADFRCDVLVNNAGPILQGAPVLGSEDRKWLETFDTKVMGAVRLSRALAPSMPADGSGRVINVSGISGRSLLPEASASGMSNAAVTAFTSYLAEELKGKRINVNCISPGLIATQAWIDRAEERGAALGISGEAFMDRMAEDLGVHLARWAEPREVASVALFLASDMGSYVTGQVIAVDGGLANFVV
ncbi:MAG: 3-oxoacyl-(acyl-carrier-protein) reductase [Solirubrobacterales bacterium]|nr:3-oxoacyl-(acyl-carrier-protein) reductase [Solirubrobacterales bacterium]